MTQPTNKAVTGTAATADTLAHDARNALNTVSLTMQLLERMIGREAMAEESRKKMLERIGAIGVEVEKVRSGVEQLRRLSHPEPSAGGDRGGVSSPRAGDPKAGEGVQGLQQH